MKTKDMSQDMEQLLLDFETSSSELKTALDRLDRAVHELDRAGGTNPQPADLESVPLRKTVNRLVGVLSAQSGLPYAVVWVLAYHELFALTGFHAVAASKAAGAHLDAVEEAEALPALRDVLLTMLVDPERTKVGGRR